ncbi:MAG TPA: hypothetical protein VLE53_12005 [Gemmatimonadaceae bacterium]|nr:hypothetical protein [Gemmatimonadaceae bacterium]
MRDGCAATALRSPPALPRGTFAVARAGVVSWLRAAGLAFPTR